MTKALETVRTLAEKARRKHLPNRAELVQLALELLEDHMEHIEHFVTDDGREIDKPRPQRQAANKALEVAAALALKYEKPGDADQPPMKPEEFASELDERGLMVVSKKDGKPVLLTQAPEGERIQ